MISPLSLGYQSWYIKIFSLILFDNIMVDFTSYLTVATSLIYLELQKNEILCRRVPLIIFLLILSSDIKKIIFLFGKIKNSNCFLSFPHFGHRLLVFLLFYNIFPNGLQKIALLLTKYPIYVSNTQVCEYLGILISRYIFRNFTIQY